MLSVTHIIQSGGLVLLGLFLFAEVGLFLGFFLPGDTLLIAAGIYAKEGKLAIAGVIIVAAIAATAGDSTAYLIGRKLGRKVFRSEDGVIFRKDHVQKAEAFYEKHGPKTLLIAHFLPVVRTFTPLLAGVGKMRYTKFLSFDAIGDTCWAVLISLAGYYVGSRVPNVDHYILLALGAVIVITLSPTIYHVAKISFKKRRGDRQN
ncbi:MAG TPA: VTT domain-containing protein [Verrucomicrobiae bacterium]|jgi:membrane-associated protein|nr:VTT domain-containing protein [Verrucomicrobiae bacterium]